MRKLAIIGMAALGKLVTLYMLIVKLQNTEAVCPIGGANGCAIAAASSYASIGQVPTALVGFIVWVLLLFFAIQYYRTQKNIWPILGLSGVGVAAAGYYNAAMLVKLQTVCLWCEMSHALMLGTFFVASSLAYGHQSRWALKTFAVAAALFIVPFVIALTV